MDKKQKEERRRQEDQALNRGLIWVGAAIVLELLLLFVKRYYLEFRPSEVEIAIAIRSGLKALRLIGTAVAVICAVWAAARLKKGDRAGLPIVLAMASGALAICAHVSLAFKASGVQMLFLLVPAWAGLALVYYLYQKEFFLAAVANGLSVFGLWFIRSGGVGPEAVLVLVGIVLVSAAALWFKQKNGEVSVAGIQLRVFPKDTSYGVVLATCLASLAAVVLALAMGGTVAYYLIFLMVAWLFALLVYYTVKMM